MHLLREEGSPQNSNSEGAVNLQDPTKASEDEITTITTSMPVRKSRDEDRSESGTDNEGIRCGEWKLSPC